MYSDNLYIYKRIHVLLRPLILL